MNRTVDNQSPTTETPPGWHFTSGSFSPLDIQSIPINGYVQGQRHTFRGSLTHPPRPLCSQTERLLSQPRSRPQVVGTCAAYAPKLTDAYIRNISPLTCAPTSISISTSNPTSSKKIPNQIDPNTPQQRQHALKGEYPAGYSRSSIGAAAVRCDGVVLRASRSCGPIWGKRGFLGGEDGGDGDYWGGETH